ncbi:MAG: hypothetical protein IJ511_10430 [Bacteroides sp.]|nr:hypothetical protein [Bacteroides sp.]
MRKILILLIAFVALALIPGCSDSPSVMPSRLVQLDSLLQQEHLQWNSLFTGEKKDSFVWVLHKNNLPAKEDAPEWRHIKYTQRSPLDSLITALLRFPEDSLHHEADHAYRALLLAEAQVKDCIYRIGDAYPNFTDAYAELDSLLDVAMAYYDRRKLPSMQARVYFLAGFRQRIRYGASGAVRYFLQAAECARETGDKRLLVQSYKYMAKEYGHAEVNVKCDSLYNLVEQLAQELGDTTLWMEAIYTLQEVQQRLAWSWNSAEMLQRATQGLELARASGNENYEAHFALLKGELYLNYCRDAGAKQEALRCGRQAEQLGLQHGRLLELMARSYVALGEYDSAAVYFDRLYGGPDWRIKGVRIYKKGSYSNGQNYQVAAVEEAFLKERQKQNYEGFLIRYKYAIVGIVLFSLLVLSLLRLFYRYKYHRQRALLLEQQGQARLYYDTLQESLQQKEREITLLQAQLAERDAQVESARQALSSRLDMAHQARALLAKEALEHSPAYTKMQLIIADCRWKEASDSRMDETDWQTLAEGVNACRNNILTRLADHYGLTDREMHLCILLLLDVPVSHIAYLMEYSRPIVYRDERGILTKMGEKYEKGKLRNLLKSI